MAWDGVFGWCAIPSGCEGLSSLMIVTGVIEQSVRTIFGVWGFTIEFCGGCPHVEAVTIVSVPCGCGDACVFAGASPEGLTPACAHHCPAVGLQDVCPASCGFEIIPRCDPVILCTFTLAMRWLWRWWGVVKGTEKGKQSVELVKCDGRSGRRTTLNDCPWFAVVVESPRGWGDHGVSAVFSCFCNNVAMSVSCEFPVTGCVAGRVEIKVPAAGW